jgi:hypothetical protein
MLLAGKAAWAGVVFILLPTGVSGPRRLTTIMGIVHEDGEKLRFVTEQRAWKVDNPETLKGHDGHYVHVEGYAYPDIDLIHITEVKIPTAHEAREADIK